MQKRTYKIATKNCQFCGKEFTSNERSIYCSKQCKKKMCELRAKSVLQVCKICGEEFIGNNLNLKYSVCDKPACIKKIAGRLTRGE